MIRTFPLAALVGVLSCMFSAGAAVAADAKEHQPPLFEEQTLFKSGVGGYAIYRIPSLVVTNQGTILSLCEARKNNSGDWGDIDLALRRSVDGGRTWSQIQIIADDGGNTMGNPCPVVDRSTGTIWLPFTTGSAPGRGNEQVLLIKSTDDGQSWSKPVNISKMAKDPAWPMVGTGPGHGIQLKSGRLLIPCWADSTGNSGEIQTSYCFYSDDHGTTWKRGQPLTRNASDECDVVELVDGRVYLNARSRGMRQRAYAFSKDGGQSWSEVKYDPNQPELECDGALIRLTDTSGFEKNRILVACPANPKARDHMTIRLSYDECGSWPVAKVLNPGYSGYSDLAIANNHTILCLYETDGCSKVTLARFNLEWLTDVKDSVRARMKRARMK